MPIRLKATEGYFHIVLFVWLNVRVTENRCVVFGFSTSDDRHKVRNSELQQTNASFLTPPHRRKALLHSIEHFLPSKALLQVIIYIFIKYPRNFRATIGQFEFIISP